MSQLLPLNLKKWIEENRELLKPPVGNRQIWANQEFMVTVVGGPNARKDFHVNEGQEFFYQLEGDISLGVTEINAKTGKREFSEIPIRAGDIFLLPGGVPHSPKRPAHTIGLVIERRRLPAEQDGFQWFCEGCGEKLHEEFFHLTDLVTQLPPVFTRFWSNPAHTKCGSCGKVMEPPSRAQEP